MKVRKSLRTWLRDHPRIERPLRAIHRRRKRLIVSFILLAHVAGALTSVQAIMETRTAQGAVAWAVSLNTLPYVAVPAYWIFGRTDFNGYVTARHTEREKMKGFWTSFEDQLKEQDLLWKPERKSPFVSEKLAKLPATGGNDAELLVDGDATFASIFDGISRAKDCVLVQFYIVRDDSVGRGLRNALVERSRAGVRCLMLYDEIGASLPDAYLDSLQNAGVRMLPFNTTKGDSNRFQLNFRNHRKIVVVDGREAWVGGLNVGDEYKGLDPETGYWRDTHMRVEGPVVQSVQISFAEDWHWATKEMIQGLEWTPRPAANGAAKGMLCLPSGPVDPLETCTLFFLHAINMAEKRLWITSPYFVPDEQFVSALQLAALRGVDVRILIPDETDNALVNLSGWSYVPQLQTVGIKVYRDTKGFMHHKVMVIENHYSTVGTANFNRSFRLNFEITMGIDDIGFASQVVKMLEQDFSNARVTEVGEFQKKSFWFKFWVQLSRLTAPVQ